MNIINKRRLIDLNKIITNCNTCERLFLFRNKVANQKRKMYLEEKYWGKPVTGFGDINAKRWLREGKCAFLPEEREMWFKIQNMGFTDSWRSQNPGINDKYTWFDYRSRMFDQDPKRGLRIDQILVSESLKSSIKTTGMDYDARAMEKPSDHCPIWLELA